MAAPSHPRPPRRQPLVAGTVAKSHVDRPVVGVPVGAPGRPSRRSAGVTVAAGVGVGLAAAALTFSVIALPLYMLAELDADGLDRPLVRDSFFGVALPIGLVVGLVVGVVVGVALARGGQLPKDRTSFHER